MMGKGYHISADDQETGSRLRLKY